MLHKYYDELDVLKILSFIKLKMLVSAGILWQAPCVSLRTGFSEEDLHTGMLTNRKVTDYKWVALDCPIYKSVCLMIYKQCKENTQFF